MQNMLEGKIPLRRSPSLHICTSLHLPIVQGLRPLYHGAPSSAPNCSSTKKRPHSRNLTKIDKTSNIFPLGLSPICWLNSFCSAMKMGYVFGQNIKASPTSICASRDWISCKCLTWRSSMCCLKSWSKQCVFCMFCMFWGGWDPEILWGFLEFLVKVISNCWDCWAACLLAASIALWLFSPRNVNEEKYSGWIFILTHQVIQLV